MLDANSDKKELATNRLLEILRGDAVEEESSAIDAHLGLSDEEQEALAGGDRPSGAKESILPDLKQSFSVKSIVDGVWRKAKSIIYPTTGKIGIDIGSESIKYVYFAQENDEYILKDMGIRKIEEHYTGDPEKKLDNLKKALNEMIPEELKKSAAISATVYGRNVSIKKVSMPKIAKKDLKDAVIWNAKKDLPFSGDNATIDFKITGEVEEQGIEKIEILAAVVEQTLIENQIKLFDSISIEPTNISAIPLSIYYNFLNYSDDPENAKGVVIDIGAKMTNIIFVQDGNLQFAREITTAGNDISEGMVGTLSSTDGVIKIDLEEAERLKFVYGIPSGDVLRTTDHGVSLTQIASIMRPALERLMVQIQRSFDYYRTKFPYEEPEKVYITGGTALLKNIEEFLAEGLNKSVKILDPLKKITVDPALEEEKNISGVAPSLSVAIGTVFSDKKGINLLPQELKDKLLFSIQKRILSVAAIFVFLIMSAFSFFAFTEYRSVSKDLERSRVEKLPSDTNQSAYTLMKGQIDQIVNDMQAEESYYQAFAGQRQIKDYLYLLSMMTPRQISLESVTVEMTNTNTITLFGRIFTDLSFAQFELNSYFKKLESSGMFQRIYPYISGQQELELDPEMVQDNSLWFEIVCDLYPTVNYD